MLVKWRLIFGDTVLSQRKRYQKNILQCLIFCKNEACVNCGTLNATTLIWLLRGCTIFVVNSQQNYNRKSYHIWQSWKKFYIYPSNRMENVYQMQDQVPMGPNYFPKWGRQDWGNSLKSHHHFGFWYFAKVVGYFPEKSSFACRVDSVKVA